MVIGGDITFDQGGTALSNVDKAGRAIKAHPNFNNQLAALDLVPDLDEEAKASIRGVLFAQRRDARMRAVRRGVVAGLYGAALALSAFITVDSNSHIQSQTAWKLSHPFFHRAQDLHVAGDYLQTASTLLVPPPNSKEAPNPEGAKRYIDSALSQIGRDPRETSWGESISIVESDSGSLLEQSSIPSARISYAIDLRQLQERVRGNEQNYLKLLGPYDKNIQKATQNRTLGGIGFLTLLALLARALLSRGLRRLLRKPVQS